MVPVVHDEVVALVFNGLAVSALQLEDLLRVLAILTNSLNRKIVTDDDLGILRSGKSPCLTEKSTGTVDCRVIRDYCRMFSFSE